MKIKTEVKAGGLLGFSLVAWVFWGVYTIAHAEDPVTLDYMIGSAGTILAPLVLALILLARDTG